MASAKDCPMCEGKKKCLRCKGEGRVQNLIFKPKCPACKGIGLCPGCKGSGKA